MTNKQIKKRLSKIRQLKIRYKIVCLTGRSHSNWLKKHEVFAEFGDNVLYTPDTLPNNPKLVKIHNNVKIAAGVKFYEHDVINQVFRDMNDNVVYTGHKTAIEIMDNVFVGAYSIIIGNVKIGPNAIIGAGSVVVSDVPPGTIVAGNPAVIIGNFEDLHKKRYLSDTRSYSSIDAQYEDFWKDFYNETRSICKDKRK